MNILTEKRIEEVIEEDELTERQQRFAIGSNCCYNGEDDKDAIKVIMGSSQEHMRNKSTTIERTIGIS